MIQAYFDDSSDSNRAEFVAYGGIFGNAFDLDVAALQWTEATKMLDAPFRSTDCECGYGQFSSWSKSDRDTLMTKLVGLLCDPVFRIQQVGSVVPVSIYREVFPEAAPNDPSRLALRHLLIQMARIARKAGMQRVRARFEKGTNDADIRKAYEEVSDYRFVDISLRNRFANLSFGDKTVPQLQAADLVARESYKVNQNIGDRPFRKPLIRMWNQTGIVGWRRDYLELLKSYGEPLLMQSLEKLPDEAFMMQIIATPYSVTKLPI
jgi:hypothetical protein